MRRRLDSPLRRRFDGQARAPRIASINAVRTGSWASGGNSSGQNQRISSCSSGAAFVGVPSHSLTMSTGQAPHVRVDMFVRAAVDEQDSAFSNQRCGDDLGHERDFRTTLRQERPQLPLITLGRSIGTRVPSTRSGPGADGRTESAGALGADERASESVLTMGLENAGSPSPPPCVNARDHNAPPQPTQVLFFSAFLVPQEAQVRASRFSFMSPLFHDTRSIDPSD